MQRRFPEAMVFMLATADSALVTGMFHVITRLQVRCPMMRSEPETGRLYAFRYVPDYKLRITKESESPLWFVANDSRKAV